MPRFHPDEVRLLESMLKLSLFRTAARRPHFFSLEENADVTKFAKVSSDPAYLSALADYFNENMSLSFSETFPFGIEIKNPSEETLTYGYNPFLDCHFSTSAHQLHINESPDGKHHDQAIAIPDIFNTGSRPDIISIGGIGGSMLMGCLGIMILGRNRTTLEFDFIGTHMSRYTDPGCERNPYHPMFHLREFLSTHDQIQFFCAANLNFSTSLKSIPTYNLESIRRVLEYKLNFFVPTEAIHDSNGLVYFPKLKFMYEGGRNQALTEIKATEIKEIDTVETAKPMMCCD